MTVFWTGLKEVTNGMGLFDIFDTNPASQNERRYKQLCWDIRRADTIAEIKRIADYGGIIWHRQLGHVHLGCYDNDDLYDPYHPDVPLIKEAVLDAARDMYC